MKPKAPLPALIVLLILCIALSSHTGEEEAGSFVLPAALSVIEDSAFAGTAPERVVLQEGAVSIGEEAFANARNLLEITIPKSVRYIGEHAFEGVSGLTIRGEKDSYAARWAGEHQIGFVQTVTAPVWLERLRELLSSELLLLLPFLLSCPEGKRWQRRRAAARARSMRPQDRPELYPINYRFP